MGAAINPSAQGTTIKHTRLGTRYADPFGRVFHYGYVTTAVGRGKMARAAAVITNHNLMSFQTAPAVGDQTVKVTLAGTALTADQYQDGWFVVQDGTGEGRIYAIEGNDAQTTTTGTGVIYLQEPIDTAGAISELNTDLIYNKYDELLPPASTSQDLIPVGVPIAVGGGGAAEFVWLQTWGPCSVWQDEARNALGEPITWGTGTGTGQLEGADAATEVVFGVAGPAAAVADEYQLTYLNISF